MKLRDVFYAIGDFFEWTFGILPVIANVPNVIFFIIIAAFFLYWTFQLVKFRRAGER